MLSAIVLIASCSSSQKYPSRTGKVIILKESKATGKDNGLHKGWSKNTNNPHHPRTTNPGHTKSKPGKGKAVKGGKAAKGKKK